MLKYVPTDASLVLCSTNPVLSRDVSLGVLDTVLAYNSLEVNRPPTNSEGLPLLVFVLSIEDKPLMPTKCARARKMLANGKAKLVKRFPFTIQLTYVCGNIVQEVSLGIDSGYTNVGFSATTDKRELISGTLVLDGRTKERLKEKSMYRRERRQRHTWYRESRFNNRVREAGWLPPSVERRYLTHLKLIDIIQRLLPITQITVEVANFDIQKLEDSDIEGKDYQQGTLYGYRNRKSYLMVREKCKCEHCKETFTKTNPSHMHHRVPKSRGGTDKPDNLMLIHKKCHQVIHKDIKLLKKYERPSTNICKYLTFMNIINKQFAKDIPDVKITYGYITSIRRDEYCIEKSHNNDAFVISNGTIQTRVKPITIIQKHRNNRSIQLNRKGYKPSIRRQRYGIQPKDIVWIVYKQYRVLGIQNYGKYVRLEDVKKVYPVTLIQKHFTFGSFVWNI